MPLMQQEPDSTQQQPDMPAPFLQEEVPMDQQPAMELREMRAQAFFDWPEQVDYAGRIARLFGALSLVFGLPVALSTFDDLPQELPQVILASSFSSGVLVLCFVLRLRQGWGYVSSRLTDRYTYFEKNQRGYQVEKNRATMLRDRLLDEYDVQPTLKRIDSSLLKVVGATAACLVALQISMGGSDPYERFSPEYLGQLQQNEQLAASEQDRAQRQAALPAYCDSRYYKAVAGGETVCK